MPSSKVKIKYPLWLLIGYLLVARLLLVTSKHSQALVLNKIKTIEN